MLLSSAELVMEEWLGRDDDEIKAVGFDTMLVGLVALELVCTLSVDFEGADGTLVFGVSVGSGASVDFFVVTLATVVGFGGALTGCFGPLSLASLSTSRFCKLTDMISA